MCRLTLTSLFLLLCVLAIILTLSFPLSANVAFILLYIEGLLLGMSIYMLVLAAKEYLYKRTVRIRDLVSTRLEIQTSAFKDLDIDTNEEITKDYLIFESKKERV
jgi:hypothetical protein